jgi:hypothetical protein
LLALLSGCSGLRVIDNDVNTFALWPGASPASGMPYRFERLPSQQALAIPGGMGGIGAMSGAELTQDQIEAFARAALGKVGLVNNPAAPALDIQVSTSLRYAQRYPSTHPFYTGSGISLGAGTSGSFIGFSFPLTAYEAPLYVREVSIVIRDTRSHAVVYETRAAHSGVWRDSRAVIPAMLDAALQGFPNPPAGERRVNIEIPR